MLKLKTLAAVCAIAAVSSFAHAEDGVSANEIVFGSSNDISGPVATDGQTYLEGIKLALERVNKAGVNGRKVKLIHYDDKYNPDEAVKNTEKLINEDKVFGLIGYLGTGTSAKSLPVTMKNKVPFIFMRTGSDLFKVPVKSNVFTMRTTITQEMEATVDHFVKDTGAKQIALVYQNDPYGDLAKSGFDRAMMRRNMKPAAEVSYDVKKATDQAEQVKALKASGADAVIFAGINAAAASYAKEKSGLLTAYASIVAPEEITARAGAAADGAIMTKGFPDPTSDTPIGKQFLEDAKAAKKTPNSQNFEGYVSTMVMADALKRTGANPTREGFIKALEETNIEWGPLKVTMGPNQHQGYSTVLFTKINGGKEAQIGSFK